MHIAAFLLASAVFVFVGSSEYTQEPMAVHAADKPNEHALFDRVVENQKKSDAAMDVYERLERVEIHKVNGENQSTEVKVSRVVPAGTGAAHLPVGADGKVSDQNAYRAELEAKGVKVGPMKYPFYSPRGEFRVNDVDGYTVFVSHAN